MKKSTIFRLFALVAAMMCALGASAAQAYANYTSSNTTLTFYYDNLRSTRTGTTYDLNTGDNSPGWRSDLSYKSVTQVVFDSSFGNFRPTTTFDWFMGMENLLSMTGMENLNTSEVTNMAAMFDMCKSLTSLDLSHFNTAKVTIMTYMFINCINLKTIYVGSGWSTASATSNSYMFYNCNSLVGGQGTTYDADHTNAAYAHIDGGPSNPGYFTDINAPQPYACYTPSNTTLTFYYDNQRSSRTGTTYDLYTGTADEYPDWYNDGTYANVTKVVFDSSFANARPTSTCYWFSSMTHLQSITNIKYLNTSEVTNMATMFHKCSGLTSLDLSSFNTTKVTRMYNMFYNCTGLTSLDLSGFNTPKVTNMGGMFRGCTSLRTVYVSSGWTTAAVSFSGNMFTNCTSIVGGQGTTYDASHTDAAYARIDGGTSNPGYFTAKPSEAYACYTPENTTLTFYYDTQRSTRTGTTYNLNKVPYLPAWYNDCNENVSKVVFDPSFANALPTTTSGWFYGMQNLQSITGMEYLNTANVTDMSDMFYYCEHLTTLDLSNFNTSKVYDMNSMFKGCSGLTNLDVSHFNTASVTNMSYMFQLCSSLTSLDLSSFNTSNVTDMLMMFRDCLQLRTIYVGDGWSTAAVTSSTNMFQGCTNLMGGKGTTYDENHVNKAYAHIDGGPSNPGYFTDKSAVLRGDVDGDGDVTIDDVTALIDYLLGTNSNINQQGADADQSGDISIDDVTALIDYLLTSHW